MSGYQESGEWEIDTTETTAYVENNQSYLLLTITIIRKPLYFAFNIVIPVLVLCLLNGTVFLLPAESGERVGFSVTCFLSFVVLLNMIMDILPRSSSPISFLCYYLVVMMCSSGAMTLVTILLMRVYHKPEKTQVPKWMQRSVTFINCGCSRLKCCVLCWRGIKRKCSTCKHKALTFGRKQERTDHDRDCAVKKFENNDGSKPGDSDNSNGCFVWCKRAKITNENTDNKIKNVDNFVQFKDEDKKRPVSPGTMKKERKLSIKSATSMRRKSVLGKRDSKDLRRRDSSNSIQRRSSKGLERRKCNMSTSELDAVSTDISFDSLADLEEEVGWAEVGRICDTFFFLVFTGGQAFFTVVFLVPLFTTSAASNPQ